VGIQKGSLSHPVQPNNAAARGKQSLWGQCCVNICPLETASHAGTKGRIVRHQVSLSTNAARSPARQSMLKRVVALKERERSQAKSVFYLWEGYFYAQVSNVNAHIMQLIELKEYKTNF
jgi:hypothetical protein